MSDDDDEAYARRTDPDTSHFAAGSFDSSEIAKVELILLKVIASHFEGATCYELCNITGIPVQTVSPRFKPMREVKGLITERYTDEGVKITRKGISNRQQTVWFATGLGALRAHEEGKQSLPSKEQ